MSDLIRVVDLEVFAQIGVPAEERQVAQRLLISLEIAVDSFSPAAQADDVAATVDYAEVVRQVKSLVSRQPRRLLETLAEEIAGDLLKKFPMQKITLEIKKFVVPETRYVSVKIERTRFSGARFDQR